MTKKPYPSEQQDRFIVRLPDGMRDRIAEAARANNRSMNAEVVARLEATFESYLPLERDAQFNAINDLVRRVIEELAPTSFETILRKKDRMSLSDLAPKNEGKK